jgi:DNA-binding CsgD family transcriptional regulator
LAHTPIDTSAFPNALQLSMASENWELFMQMQAGLQQGASLEQLQHGVDFIRQATSQQDWLARWRAGATSNVSDLLREMHKPALLLHGRGVTFLKQEESAKTSTALPNARLVLINEASASTVGDTDHILAAIDDFVASLPAATDASPTATGHPSPAAGLSTREIEVLRLLAAGKSNAQIAEELVISQNTVIRHVSNIFAKIGAENRAQAAVYARDRGIG